MTATKTAATRLVESVHAQVTARATEQGVSVSEYLEQLVLRDLEQVGEAETTAAGRGVEVLAGDVVELLRKQHAELLELTNKLGELAYGTRVAFFNFALLWSQVVAGKVDAKNFDWARWAEDHLATKPKGGRTSVTGDGRETSGG